jgi:hypothetical protein
MFQNTSSFNELARLLLNVRILLLALSDDIIGSFKTIA